MRCSATLSVLLLATQTIALQFQLQIPERISFTISVLRDWTSWNKEGRILDTQSPLPPAVAAADSYWLEDIKHQGFAAFNPDTSYQVFRNVKDFGAKGCVMRPLSMEVQL